MSPRFRLVVIVTVALAVWQSRTSWADNVSVRPWGENALRVQIAPSWRDLSDDLQTGYLPDGPEGYFTHGPEGPSELTGPVTSGNIKAEQGGDGLLTVTRVSDGKVLLKETERRFGEPSAPSNVTWDFSASSTKVYGLGQNRHDNNGAGLPLDVINETYDFQHSLSEEGGPSNSLPWALGANPTAGGFQWGCLFNSPSLGGVAFTPTAMTWSIVADAGNQAPRQQFDFLITTHTANATAAEKPFQIVEKYVDAVGHAPKLPYPGYWHSKNRYKTQEELLEVARGFHNRSIPVDVIVIDYHHWKKFGDWSFDEQYWPDPQAMVDECLSYGIEIMVSVWPYTCLGSRSYDNMTKNNWITTYVADNGSRTDLGIETAQSYEEGCYLVDPTNPAARDYIWSLIETGYYQYGIKIFWLDASEPEGFGPQSTNASWAAGNMRDMASMFSLYWTQTFYDGLKAHDETDIVMLSRGGWVGTWRHGSVLWSGDIGTTMEVLKSQVNIGLSAQMSGIPWWTTDIGGYKGGSAEDPTYREVIVRWFQYGMTCPLFRAHGNRDKTAIWYYGEIDEKILGDIIKLRADLEPYITEQLNALSATGRPFNRPLMWDFPEDPKTWELADNGIGDDNTTVTGIADQFMMGDGYMVAPVLNLGQRNRSVYFPLGADWQHHYTGQLYKGGTTAVVDAPLENFPFFKLVNA